MSRCERYIIRWIPEADVVKRATALGWRDDDGSSWWDHLEADDCERSRPAPNLPSALAMARQLTAVDVFHETRVVRQSPEWDHIGGGEHIKRWEDREEWIVPSDSEPYRIET